MNRIDRRRALCLAVVLLAPLAATAKKSRHRKCDEDMAEETNCEYEPVTRGPDGVKSHAATRAHKSEPAPAATGSVAPARARAKPADPSVAPVPAARPIKPRSVGER